MGQEMALWKAVMASLYGESWKDLLMDLEPPEEQDDEEASQPEASMLDIFNQARGAEESVAEHDARRLRAGTILLAQRPEQLGAADKALLEVLRETSGKTEKEARDMMKIMFFDALRSDDQLKGAVVTKLLGERGAAPRQGATADEIGRAHV